MENYQDLNMLLWCKDESGKGYFARFYKYKEKNNRGMHIC